MLALMLCWIISVASTSLKWHNSESFWEPEIKVSYSLVPGDMDRPGSYCSMWKGFVPILVFVSFAGFRATYLNSKYTRHQLFKAPLPQENYIKRVKRILFFTPYFGMADWGIGFGSEPFEKCSDKNCFVTNKGNPEDFDAILFHARNFKGEQVGHESWLSWDMFHWKILTKTDDLCRFLIREEDDRNRWRFFKNLDFLQLHLNFFPFLQLYVFVSKESPIHDQSKKWSRFLWYYHTFFQMIHSRS